MPVSTCLLNLDRTQRELSPHGTPDFPCAVYDETYAVSADAEFPWHWHEEIELLYIADGSMTVQVPGKSFELKAGDSAFINSGILHYGKTADWCRLCSLVFSPLLIAGTGGSVIDKKYVQPVIHYAPLDCFFCTQKSGDAAITQCMVAAFNALRDGAPGAELTARENLSHLFFIFAEKYKDEMKLQTDEENNDSVRVRKMMAYIQKHLAEPVTLTEIAASGAVGERECLRCFRHSIQISPVQYLIMCRLHESAVLLRENDRTDISDIALNCGFASPSSFTQLFRRYYQCTPREYRKRKEPR